MKLPYAEEVVEVTDGMVTEEQWYNALYFSNITNYTVYIDIAYPRLENKRDDLIEIETDGHLAWGSFDTDGVLSYIGRDERENGYTYTYDEGTETWSRVSFTDESGRMDRMFYLGGDHAIYFINCYSSFRYDKASDSYKADEMEMYVLGQDLIARDVTLKFYKGWLRKISFTASVNGEEVIYTFKYANYWTTNVVLPEAETVAAENRVVTAEEWEAAFDLSDKTNYILEGIGSIDTDESYHYVKDFFFRDGKLGWYWKTVLEDEKTEYYGRDEQGNVYRYIYDEETGWSRTVAADYDFEASDLSAKLAGIFKGKYPEFGYNLVTNAYEAENVELGDWTFDKISIAFDGGQVKSISFFIDNDDMFLKYEFVYFSYGTTTVVLPNVSQEAGETEENVTTEENATEGTTAE
jgi:hypothetical protein